MPQIEVPPDTDANGILNISAKDKDAGKEHSITASSGLSREEIEQMASDADRFAEENERKRQEIQTRNNAENAAYAAEQMLRDNADNIPEDLKGKVATVRSALQNDDIARVETTLSDLQESLQKVGQAMLLAGQSGSGPRRRSSHRRHRGGANSPRYSWFVKPTDDPRSGANFQIEHPVSIDREICSIPIVLR